MVEHVMLLKVHHRTRPFRNTVDFSVKRNQAYVLLEELKVGPPSRITHDDPETPTKEAYKNLPLQ